MDCGRTAQVNSAQAGIVSAPFTNDSSTLVTIEEHCAKINELILARWRLELNRGEAIWRGGQGWLPTGSTLRQFGACDWWL